MFLSDYAPPCCRCFDALRRFAAYAYDLRAMPLLIFASGIFAAPRYAAAADVEARYADLLRHAAPCLHDFSIATRCFRLCYAS